jgi:phage/plasmid-like protein (TIGR03299 family)
MIKVSFKKIQTNTGEKIMAALVESMFSVKQIPWHQQGEVLMDYPTTDEAYVKSGLNWTVNKVQMSYPFNGESKLSSDFALVRDLDGEQLGTCKSGYEIFQNIDGFEWCRPLVETDLWKYETAGSLRGGVVGWILLKQGEIELVHKDVLKQYLLLTWAHDGSKPVQPMSTSIRVVCNNTLTAALNEATHRTRVKHTSKMNMKLEEIRKLYETTKEQFDHQQEMFSRMLDFKMTEGMINEYIDKVMENAFSITNLDEMKDCKKKTINQKIKATLLDGAFNGTGTNELGIANTMYATFNGVEEAVEHSLGGKRVVDRGMNILFGTGRGIVDTAYNTALNMMQVA